MPDLTLTSAVDTFLGSADQAAMRTNLGLGTMATQAASAVAITGGTFAGLSVQAGSGSGRISINHDINGVLLGSTTSTIQFYDTYLSRGGAAHVLMMGVSGASPATQCFKAASGVGTNIGGGKLLCVRANPRECDPARLALQGTTQGASGSTAQTYADVLSVLNSHYIEIGDGVTINGTGSGFRLGSSMASLLGFWGAAPVAQFNWSGGAGIYGTGSGNPVLDDSTFVGSTGSTAYTVNDLISALKLCGVLAA
ncbi:MAG: hypothetical protein IPM06_18410 [Rhizobiales bacterium]|nr:hypothetical protein [Hyphomicrobiales bacterium]